MPDDTGPWPTQATDPQMMPLPPRVPDMRRSEPVTHDDMRSLATKIVAAVLTAGIIGAISLVGVSYMALHDVRRDVADVRTDQQASTTAHATAAERHGASGHHVTTEALHDLDIRLAEIKTELREMKDRLPRRMR